MTTAAQASAKIMLGPLTEDETFAMDALAYPVQDCGYHHDPKARCWACANPRWDDREAQRVAHHREHRRSIRRMYA